MKGYKINYLPDKLNDEDSLPSIFALQDFFGPERSIPSAAN